MGRRVISVAAAAVAVAVVAGCGGGEAPPPITATFDTSATKVFDGPEGVGKSLQQQATDAATEVITNYYEVMAKLTTTSDGSVSQLKTLTMDPDPTEVIDNLSATALGGTPMLEASTAEVNAARKARWGGSGEKKVTNWQVTNWQAPADSAGVPEQGVAFVEMRVCVDVSEFKPLLPDKKPAYNPNRRPAQLQKFLVLNKSWPDKSAWRLATQYVKSESPCTAA